MKTSIFISICMLLIFVVIGIQKQTQLTEAKVDRKVLLAEAKSLDVKFQADGKAERLITRTGIREDKLVEARALAQQLIEISLENEKVEESGETLGSEDQLRMMEIFEKVLSLDSEQMRALLADFQANDEMKEDTKNGMMFFAMMSLSTDHPEAALTIYLENEAMQEGMMGQTFLLSSTLAGWAAKDPEAALAWVRENADEQGAAIDDNAKSGLVSGLGATNLKAAFELIAELNFEDSSDGLNALAQIPATAAERKEFLELLRGSDDKENAARALSRMADGIFSEDFAEATSWIKVNELSEDEFKKLTGSISYHTKGPEQGKWAQWAGDSLKGKERENAVWGMVRQYTEDDYPAAGKWLLDVPAGETKNIAVSAYVNAIAKYDQNTATQWAMTLPVGERRVSALKDIYKKLPSGTDAEVSAKESFKAKHGVE